MSAERVRLLPDQVAGQFAKHVPFHCPAQGAVARGGALRQLQSGVQEVPVRQKASPAAAEHVRPQCFNDPLLDAVVQVDVREGAGRQNSVGHNSVSAVKHLAYRLSDHFTGRVEEIHAGRTREPPDCGQPEQRRCHIRGPGLQPRGREPVPSP